MCQRNSEKTEIMRFRSGRRTAAGSSRSENLLDQQQVKKEQRSDVIKTENQLDLDPALPVLKRSVSPSSVESDTRPALFKRKGPIQIKQYCFTEFSPWKTTVNSLYVHSLLMGKTVGSWNV